MIYKTIPWWCLFRLLINIYIVFMFKKMEKMYVQAYFQIIDISYNYNFS